MRRAVAPAVGVLVVLGVAALWWFRPWAEVTARGGTVPLDDGYFYRFASRAEADVLMPGTTVHVQVGQPVGSIDGLDRSGSVRDAAHAARLSRFVPISWDAEDTLLFDTPGTAGLQGAALGHLSVTVHAGDRTIDLGDLGAKDEGSLAVVVPRGDVDDLTVDVAFDGAVQQVHTDGTIEEGVAQALYDGTLTHDFCTLRPVTSPGVGLRRRVYSQCLVDVGPRQPWTRRYGWVTTPGQGWVTAAVQTQAPYDVSIWPREDGAFQRAQAHRKVASYRLHPTSATVSAVVDGTPVPMPLHVHDDEYGLPTSDETVTWLTDAPPSAIRIEEVYDVVVGPHAPYDAVHEVTFRADVAVTPS